MGIWGFGCRGLCIDGGGVGEDWEWKVWVWWLERGEGGKERAGGGRVVGTRISFVGVRVMGMSG